MRLAALQMRTIAGEVEANLARIEAGAAEAAAAGAALLVCPELATTGYGAGERMRQLAEPLDGPQVARLAAISGRTGIALVVGFAEAAEGGVRNSALVLQDGRLVHAYRKCHLWGPYERGLFAPSEVTAPVLEIAGRKVGLAICYDIEFPEVARALARAGAELIAVPTALVTSGHSSFLAEKMVPTRAFENQVFVAYVNHAGCDGAFRYAGLSCIAAPDGTDLARAPAEDEALLLADIDPDAYAACRAENPYLADLRL